MLVSVVSYAMLFGFWKRCLRKGIFYHGCIIMLRARMFFYMTEYFLTSRSVCLLSSSILLAILRCFIEVYCVVTKIILCNTLRNILHVQSQNYADLFYHFSWKMLKWMNVDLLIYGLSSKSYSNTFSLLNLKSKLSFHLGYLFITRWKWSAD